MSGVELIKWTHHFFEEKCCSSEDFPKFAFRAKQFYELPSETINEIFSLGVKKEDILE